MGAMSSVILIILILTYSHNYAHANSEQLLQAKSPRTTEFKFHLLNENSRLSIIDVGVQITDFAKRQQKSPFVCQTWLFSSFSSNKHSSSIFSDADISASFSRTTLDQLYPVVLLSSNAYSPTGPQFYNEVLAANNLSSVSTNTADKSRPFSYTNYEFTEDDLVRSQLLGTMRFGVNCVSVFIVGATNVKESYELTSAVVERKLAKPHQDYFMYILGLWDQGQGQEGVVVPENEELINQILWKTKAMEDMRYKYVFNFKNNSAHGEAKGKNNEILATLYNVCERNGEHLGLFSQTCFSHIINRHYKITSCYIMPLVRYENYPDGSLKRGNGMVLAMFLEASRRYNFTVEVKYAGFSGSSGFKKKDTGVWYGAVGEVFKREADIAFAVGITVHRYPIVDPSHGQTWITRIFFIRQPSLKKSWYSVLWPMEPQIWILTIITISLVLPIYHWAAVVYFNTSPTAGPRPAYLFWQVVDILNRILMEQSATARQWKGNRIRLLVLLWTGFCLVLETGYRSKLVTFLTFLEREAIPKTHLELSLSNYKLFFRTYNGVAHQFTMASKDPMHKRILQKSVLSNHSHECIHLALLTDKSACLDYRLNGQFAITMNASLTTNQNAEVLIASRDTDFSCNIVWAFRKGSPWRASFDRVILNTLAAGLYNKWKTDEWSESRIKGSQYLKGLKDSPVRNKIESIMSEMVVGPQSLPSESLEGTYLLFCLGIILSVVGWLAEHFSNFIRRVKEARKRERQLRNIKQLQVSSQ